MTRDIRIYLLIVVLPAILLVAGGIRLVTLESARAKAMVVESLNEKASGLARQIVQKLKEKGCKCRDMKPPKPPRGEERRGWRPFARRPPGARCRFHELPADVCEVVREVLAESDAAASCIAEIRHGCGAAVVSCSGGAVTGAVFGASPLKPLLPSYSVCVAPEGGDAAVAFGVRAQALFVAIMAFLLFGTMAAGVVLLVRAARRANAEARAKTDFLSNVSHELKTPLTSIAMFSEMLAAGSLEGEAMRKASGTVLRESKRLGRLIDGLLEYARLERGARKYEIAEFDVIDELENAVASFAPSFPEGLAIANESPNPAVMAVCDREALRRIIDCLLENAAKYAKDSAVTLRVSAKGDGTCAAIAVEDCGSGIAPADANHIFERFWRADNSVTRTTGGAGLGLAIARELARGMGADLTFAPNSPHGAIFTLAFGSRHDSFDTDNGNRKLPDGRHNSSR